MISTFPPRTVANLNVVGFSVGGGAVNVEVFCVALLEPLVVTLNTASCATPAGESAISLMSRVVSESLRGAARDCRRSVVGPWNRRKSCCVLSTNSFQKQKGEHTLSPQIDLLAQVLRVNPVLAKNCHTPDFLISRKNLVSGNRLVIEGI